MKITKTILLFFSLTIYFYSAEAQQLTTNEFGQKIVVYPDGSWRYAEEKDVKELGKTETENPVADVEQTDEPEDVAIAIQIAEKAVVAEQEAIKSQEAAQYQRILLEDEMADLQAQEEYDEQEMTLLKERLKLAKKKEKSAKKARREAAKKVRNAGSLMLMTTEERLVALESYDLYKELKKETSEVAAPKETVLEESQAMSSEEPTDEVPVYTASNILEERPYADFVKYDRDKDPIYNPPTSDCNVTFDGVDEFSGKKRKDIASQLFFTYTNEELRPIFKDRDYMVCTGYISGLSGGITFLTLNITINSKSAQREYGVLEKGSLINIKLINGDNVKLLNGKTNIGTPNPIDGTVSYRAQYLISSGDEKKLRKSEVDKVRVIWSSGYEDYEIYELDFFIDQFNCLDQ